MKARYRQCRYMGKRMRYHVMAWIAIHEFKPDKGMVIHHADGNPMNNAPDNLVIMTLAEHSRIHSAARRRDKGGRFLAMAKTERKN